jgi:hypothetical protein
MGLLMYGPGTASVEIDDRTLAHLKVVILSKLRRDESFTLSWEADDEHGGGRELVWLDPAIALRFRFTDARPLLLNRLWLDQLMQSANTGDLHLLPEPTPGHDVPHPLGE